jgi:hypothetical protein
LLLPIAGAIVNVEVHQKKLGQAVKDIFLPTHVPYWKIGLLWNLCSFVVVVFTALLS